METVHNPIYWKLVKDKLEAANTKEASIAFRKKLLDSQNRMNNSSEYERINGILLHSSLPAVTLESLKKRREHLKALGAKAFSID
jgi:hypothetical protein